MSTGTTPNGLPYPNDDDDVRLGAQRIRELAQALSGSELTYSPAVSTGAFSASTLLAGQVIAAVNYDRVVDLRAMVQYSGVTAASAWNLVLTSDGSQVTTNVVATAGFPYSATVVLGGSATATATYDLPAGASVQPRAWAERISASGTLTVVTRSSLAIRVRRKG